MIDKLKIVAEKCICANQNNPEQQHKYRLIKEILDQRDCFLKMNINYAYSILRDLQIPEENLKNVYMQLINLNTI